MTRGTLAFGLLLGACQGLDLPPSTYRDPVAGYGGNIEVRLQDPLAWSAVTNPTVTVTAAVDSLLPVAVVELRSDGGPWEPLRLKDGSYQLGLNLRQGTNEITLRASDEQGNVSYFTTQLYYFGEAPMVRLRAPIEDGYAGISIPVAGEAAAVWPAAVSRVEVWLDDNLPEAVEVEVDGRFFATIPNGSALAPELCARVTDSETRQVQTCKVLRRDDEAPVLTLAEPAAGLVTTAQVLDVVGGAHDNTGLERVEVQINDAGWITVPDPYAFRVAVILTHGPNLLQVRARDLAGNQTTENLQLFAARTVALRTYPQGGNLLNLTLDKAGLAALVPPEQATAIDMLYLDVRGLLLESLRAMRDHDLYGIDTSSWGPAEWSMQRILTMSPDTADLTGTSLENVLGLSQGLGLPPATVLADLADLSPTDPFLTLDDVADGIFVNIIAPHPGMVVDPDDGIKKIPVTLQDAFDDLVGLADTLGPAPPHPGVLFAVPPAPVLLPNFQMTLTARSNLRQHDGIDLRAGKTYLFARQPGVELLEFDFLNPEWFTVEGVADEPEVDLNFLIVEHPSFVPAGTARYANQAGDFFRGDSAVWGIASWTSEYLVANMMFNVYHDRFSNSDYWRSFSYDIGDLTDAAVVTWAKGWLTIETVAGVGEPPPPQYLWDAVLELAQVRLHDGGLAEGDADLHLTLTGVRVPLTAEQLVASTRQVLEAQKATLAEAMVGDHSSYNSGCDLFLTQAPTGEPFLCFVHPDDIPGATTTHKNPGFFADPELSLKVSSPADQGSGDEVHEKVPVSITGGEVYYVQDLDDTVWQLTMLPLDDDGQIRVQVQPAEAWQ